jgi:hypothetical protein
MEKKKYSRVTITFDAGSQELKDKAIRTAKNFQPVNISLSSLCQVALREYIEKNERGIRK